MLLQEKWTTSDIALTVSVLALVAVAGLFIGNVKFCGAGLGIDGMLSSGITVGHFVSQAGVTLSSDTLHVIQEFGLILFVYTVGIQTEPGFFASLRISGLRLDLFAVPIVIIGDLVIAILHKLFDIPLPIVLGTFSGVVINTPALGTGQQILHNLGTPMAMVDQMGMSYAITYPFGTCGILFTMWMLRVISHVNVETEARQHESTRTNGGTLIRTINIRVESPDLHDLVIENVSVLNGDKVICSRLKREETPRAPSPETVIQLGDLLHLMGQPADSHNAQLMIGQEIDTSLSTKGTDSCVARAVVTGENVFGRRIRDLYFKERYDVVIPRLNRIGVELVTGSDISLRLGNIPNLVGCPSAIDAAVSVLGNAQQRL